MRIRQDKDGLGQAELGRDALHRRAVQALGIEHDGERIALVGPGSAAGGEHVVDLRGAFGHVDSPGPTLNMGEN